MTLSDFAYLQIYAQRHRELLAEGACRQLAREAATAGPTPCWRRLGRAPVRRAHNVVPCH
jgi:hypothetical protein